MKKQLFTIFLLSSLVACSNNGASNASSGEPTSSEPSPITIRIKPLPSVVEIHSDLVKDYFNQENYDYKDMNAFINAKTDQGDNLPIEFTWEAENLPLDSNITYSININDGSNSYTVYSSDMKIDFINYKLNTTYTLTVSAYKDGSNIGLPATYTFNTPDGYLRTITIDGVTNFRDLGDGKKLKQGMIYRSATLTNNTSANETNPISITEKGKEELNNLGIKTRIDLRKDDEKKEGEPQVVSKQIVSEPLHYGGQNILTYKNSEYDNPEKIKNIFNLLADETNYPLDIHCVRGTDRTGCIAYLVKGLLGIDEEMLYRDFLFSNFYNIGSPVKLESIYYATNPNATTKYVNVIHQAEGETLKDKIYNYLSSDKIGVSTGNLDKIINLLKA